MPFGPEHKSTFGESLDRMGETDLELIRRVVVGHGIEAPEDMDDFRSWVIFKLGQGKGCETRVEALEKEKDKAFREGYEAGVRDANNGTVTSFE